ncbi:MAG: hypothetical protein KAY11_16270 [Ilumatobacteraceae bacterium]|nr:hypothetical protein [Ilumatobacteraceae bacterium]
MAIVSEPVQRVRAFRNAVPLAVLSAAVVLVVFGLARGMWVSNLHNGLLALAFSAVGAHLVVHQPSHRLGHLFLLTGIAEAVMFWGRQVGHSPSSAVDRWWGWLGVWPIALTLALVTLSVICFPDGQLPSPRWRAVVVAMGVVTVVCAGMSAAWPVEYESAGVVATHPFAARTPEAIETLWSAIAHPAYVGFQLLWVVAVVVRWRRATGTTRIQLGVLAGAAGISVAALLTGLAVWQTPVPGVLSAALLPVAAGWAVAQGRHLNAYAALSWLSRAGTSSEDLATGLTRAVAEALSARSAILWVGDDTLHAVGVWPEIGQQIDATSLDRLLLDPDRLAAAVTDEGRVVGALDVARPAGGRLSVTEQRVFDDLVAQARFVIAHLGIAGQMTAAAEADRGRRLAALTPRENEVLELIARGLSNAAICRELHLSIKTVEPVVSSIFAKLDLHADSTLNRRVLAVVVYLRD